VNYKREVPFLNSKIKMNKHLFVRVYNAREAEYLGNIALEITRYTVCSIIDLSAKNDTHSEAMKTVYESETNTVRQCKAVLY